jgi:predicted flap endonuclease-1-like 5' DNA nuclease
VSPPPPEPGGEVLIENIDGVGALFAERLRTSGVRFARQVAEMDPVRLASILQTTEARAATIIRSAREAIGQV